MLLLKLPGQDMRKAQEALLLRLHFESRPQLLSFPPSLGPIVVPE